jgi:hypothetical protein
MKATLRSKTASIISLLVFMIELVLNVHFRFPPVFAGSCHDLHVLPLRTERSIVRYKRYALPPMRSGPVHP